MTHTLAVPHLLLHHSQAAQQCPTKTRIQHVMQQLAQRADFKGQLLLVILRVFQQAFERHWQHCKAVLLPQEVLVHPHLYCFLNGTKEFKSSKVLAKPNISQVLAKAVTSISSFQFSVIQHLDGAMCERLYNLARLARASLDKYYGE